ncbi:heme ABC exporter ATP-binding protein CcmA [uncultured Sphingomonas sp.]|uniref:heme ABC exporter ATP-binding protein CcmA n=1 Tax=uncultured Sphingomonas sp. TaxID=158754 RepID=UPI0035C96729
MTAALAFDRVSAIRRDKLLFEALSFKLAMGEAALVTGANGAGKSTLIRIAAGLLAPAAGTVSRGTTAPALLGEASALDPDLTLANALAFWTKLDHDEAGRAAAALARMDLAPLAEVPVRLLSTGQRRRAGIARVLASGARLWLLDEPANGLDARAVAALGSVIADHRAQGGTVLVATHLPIDLPGALSIELGAA